MFLSGVQIRDSPGFPLKACGNDGPPRGNEINALEDEHSKTGHDVKHSDMFIDVLEKHVLPGREQDVVTTATDSMDIHRVYFGGMAQAMEKAS